MKKADRASVETTKGMEQEEIKVIHDSELISYTTEDITFDEFTNNIKKEILKKAWVEDLKENTDGENVIFDVTSKVQKITVELSPNGSMNLGKTKVTIGGNDTSIFNYEVVDNNVRIIGLNFANIDFVSKISEVIGYNNSMFSEITIDAQKLKIPSQIDGKTVTEINWKTHLNSNLKNKVIIRGIEEIEYPDTLKKLSNESLNTEFPDVKVINLNDGLEEIGDYAFWNCNKVKSLEIPKSVNKINGRPFIGMNYNTIIMISRELSDSVCYDNEWLVAGGYLRNIVFYTDYINYTVQWYDVEGNFIKSPETRRGEVGVTVSVTSGDMSVQGYIFDSENSQNILSAELSEGGDTILRMYFKLDN